MTTTIFENIINGIKTSIEKPWFDINDDNCPIQTKYNHYLMMEFDKSASCDDVDPSVKFVFTTTHMVKLCEILSHVLESEYNDHKKQGNSANTDNEVKISCAPLRRAELGIDCQINGVSRGKHIKFPYYTSLTFDDNTLATWKSLETPLVLWKSAAHTLYFQFESYSQLSKKYHWRIEQLQLFAKHFINVIQSESEPSTLPNVDQ